MKLPSVYPLTIPSSHNTIKMIAIVSSMQPSHPALKICNMNADGGRCARAVLAAVALGVFAATSARAQETSAVPPAAADNVAVQTVKFVAGGLLGLAMHEGGHLVFDAFFDAQPRLSRVHLGPFPFFAITHRTDLTPRREFTVSSAGFWVQEATSEWLLATRPVLRERHSWLSKGVLAFNVLNSVGYALVAFARAGPPERDTRGMADSIGVDERIVGALVLAPAVLDSYRYFKRGSGWAGWTSRAVKTGSVLLVIKRRARSERY
jgi:hypothetical protein